jgi:hypothetical protein
LPVFQVLPLFQGSANLAGRRLDTRTVAQADCLTYELGNHLVAVKTGYEQRTIYSVEHI